MAKICSKCSQEKELSNFSTYVSRKPNASRDIKYRANCKECGAKHAREYRKNNPVKVKAVRAKFKKNNPGYMSTYRDRNPEQRLKDNEYAAQYRKENKEDCAERVRAWVVNNKDKRCKYSAVRRSKIKQATPKWLSFEQKLAMETFYATAKMTTEKTGQQYTVDHIFPIQGKAASGLHVPWNLQILTMKENCQKAVTLNKEV